MTEFSPEPTPAAPAPRRISPFKAALIGVAALAVGGGATAFALNVGGPTIEMAPVNPVAIRGLADESLVTIRGRVAEIFGNKAIIDDGTGRALVDLGREGSDGGLIEAGQTVTVQGRFDNGQLRASFLIDAAGNTRALAPLGPRGGPKEKGPHGPGRDGAPPPPPVDGAAAPPPSATAPVVAPGAQAPGSVTANQMQAAPRPSATAPAPAPASGASANVQGM